MSARLPRIRTVVSTRVWSDELHVTSKAPLEFIDLTDRIAASVRRSGIAAGTVNVQTRHTTTGILVNENEPLLIRDLADLLERWAPESGSYRHDDLAARGPDLPPDERRNGHAHARALLFRTSETLNVVGRRLQLGPWQRIFLVDFDGARERRVSLLVLGSGEESSPALKASWSAV